MAIGVQTAMAEAQVAQRTDPKAESPAGVIYQIPLDSARRDAAPVLPTGRRADSASGTSAGAGGPGSGAGGAGGSSTASDPAGSSGGGTHDAGAAASASSATGSGGPETDQGTPQDPSSIHSENGFGSASQVPGTSQAALRTGAGVAATQAVGSVVPTYLLIAFIAVAAVGMGLFATSHRRHRDDGRPPSARG